MRPGSTSQTTLVDQIDLQSSRLLFTKTGKPDSVMTATTRAVSTVVSAPVSEHRCLFTHDLRRKAKRWQDGFLKFHSFNKRVMCYDTARNFVGDTHFQDAHCNGLEDGDELELDMTGILVQVGEILHITRTDLSDLWLKKRSDLDGPAAQEVSPQITPKAAAVTTSHTKIPCKTLLGRPGTAKIPPTSPFERLNQHNTISKESNVVLSRKRRRDDEHIPLHELLKRNQSTQATGAAKITKTSSTGAYQCSNSSRETGRVWESGKSLILNDIGVNSSPENSMNKVPRLQVQKRGRESEDSQPALIKRSNVSKLPPQASHLKERHFQHEEAALRPSRKRDGKTKGAPKYKASEVSHSDSGRTPPVHDQKGKFGCSSLAPRRQSIAATAEGNLLADDEQLAEANGEDNAMDSTHKKHARRQTTSLRLGQGIVKSRLLCHTVPQNAHPSLLVEPTNYHQKPSNPGKTPSAVQTCATMATELHTAAARPLEDGSAEQDCCEEASKLPQLASQPVRPQYQSKREISTDKAHSPTPDDVSNLHVESIIPGECSSLPSSREKCEDKDGEGSRNRTQNLVRQDATVAANMQQSDCANASSLAQSHQRNDHNIDRHTAPVTHAKPATEAPLTLVDMLPPRDYGPWSRESWDLFGDR